MKNNKQPWAFFVYGILIGLLAVGGILLISKPQTGTPITLSPPPTATATLLPEPSQTPAPIVVQIKGAIKQPGVYYLEKDARLSDLIASAGGLLSNADEKRINLAVLIHDGDYYYIPEVNETIPETASNAPSNSNVTEDEQFEYPLDLNTASQEALESLPGIGPSKATEILAYRDENGPFKKVDDIINVPGIGPTTLETLRSYLYVSP